MPTATQLHPTLWRTCRAIANRSRLAMFGLLVEQPGQTVSAVGRQLSLPLSLMPGMRFRNRGDYLLLGAHQE
jgi:hypothetical protein